MFFDEGYTYSNFLMNVVAIFAFVVWFWLLVIIYGDLFRRHDISGAWRSATLSKLSMRATNCAVWLVTVLQTKSPNSIS